MYSYMIYSRLILPDLVHVAFTFSRGSIRQTEIITLERYVRHISDVHVALCRPEGRTSTRYCCAITDQRGSQVATIVHVQSIGEIGEV